MNTSLLTYVRRRKAGAISPTYHLNFDGVDDKIVVPASTSLNNLPLGDFTLEISGVVASLNSGEILCKCDSNEQGWDFYYNSISKQLFADVTGDDWGGYSSFIYDVDLSGVHHLELVWYIGTKSFKLFCDGIEESYSDYFIEPYASYDDDSLSDMSIGFSKYESAHIYSNGKYNWLHVSNIARHTANFTPPSLTVCPAADANTVLRLALDEGIGTTANDTSGNNNHGTITGATWEAD